MIAKVKQKIGNNKKVLENFSYLTLMHIFQLLIPLITYPYLIRVVGKELYGQVVFIQAIVIYFSVIIKFGFDMFAVKEVSVHRDNDDKLSEIVSSIYIIRSFIFVFFLIIAIVFFILVEVPVGYDRLFFYTYLLCFGELLFPIFFFQGKEKMKFITIVNLVGRVVFLFSIFLFVREKKDYVLIALLSSVGTIVGGLIASCLVFLKDKIRFKLQTMKTLSFYMRESSYYFVNSLSVILVERTNIVLLGSLISMQEVAYYDLASKIVNLAKQPFLFMGQALYPNFVQNLNKKKLVNAIGVVLGIGLGCTLLVDILGKYVVNVLGGTEMLPAVDILHLLSVLLIITPFCVVFGIALAAQGYAKDYMYADLIYLLVYTVVIASFLLMQGLNIYSISLALILGVLGNVTYRYVKVRKYKLL